MVSGCIVEKHVGTFHLQIRCLRIYRSDTKRIANQPVSVIKLDLHSIRFASHLAFKISSFNHFRIDSIVVASWKAFSIFHVLLIQCQPIYICSFSKISSIFQFVKWTKFYCISLTQRSKEILHNGKQNFVEMLVNRKTTKYVIYYCYKLSGICWKQLRTCNIVAE